MKKAVFFSLVVVLMVSSILFSAQASPANAGGFQIFEFTSMVGVPRPYTGNANPVRGLNGGGVPWVISSASGELSANGKLELRVRGLVLDPTDPVVIAGGKGGTNPVPAFMAIVSCLSKDNTGAAVTVNVPTATFPATTTGNASFEGSVSLPHPCIAPIVFVTSPGSAWFAATGAP